VNIRIRRAERCDASTLMTLIEALAAYEKLDPPTAEAQARLIEDGWPEQGTPRFSSWLAEDCGEAGVVSAIGYAITFFTYSSFLARPTLYIEDIFVLPEHRRDGAGTALFHALTEEARRTGCGRVEWVVLDWNTSAQDFYRKLGAAHLTDWQYYRLSLG
jgi:GNAT superfamily N-acetyltransferase